jgi:isoamylase
VYGYKMESGDDLILDDRDSAPFMPRCRVIDPAFTWGEERAPRIAWARTLI